MDLKLRKVPYMDYYDMVVTYGNTTIESGFLDEKELQVMQKDTISELLYYADKTVFEFIVDEYEAELEEIMSERREKGSN